MVAFLVFRVDVLIDPDVVFKGPLDLGYGGSSQNLADDLVGYF
jgi:hypothetical protein